MQSTQSESTVDLSVADVYYWMSENKYFPRESAVEVENPAVAKKENAGVKQEAKEEFLDSIPEQSSPLHRWCPICGIDTSLHSTTKFVKYEDLGEDEKRRAHSAHGCNKMSILAPDDVCHVVPRVLQIAKLPRIDIRRLLMNGDSPDEPPPSLLRNDTAMTLEDRSLVSAADSNMTMWIRQLTEDLGLFRFEHSSKATDGPDSLPTFPLDQFGDNKIDVERRLAPFALLALVTKQFAKRLVRDGMDVAERDNVIASGLAKGNRRRPKKKATTQRLLTPTHVLSGILARGRGRASEEDGSDAVILSSLSKLGIGVEPDCCAPIPASPSRQGDITQVKVEQ